MIRPTRKQLTQVAIGAYDIRERASHDEIPQIRQPEYCIRAGALYDQRLGSLGKPGWPECGTSHLACLGQVGAIPLTVNILNPFFDVQMLQYLSLFTLGPDAQSLIMKDSVGDLVQRHRYHVGFRRLKAIAEDMPGTSKWKLAPEIGSVSYEIGKNNVLQINATRLREILERTTRYHTTGDSAVKLEDLGINPLYSRPEQYVIGHIPILPNLLRAPMPGSEVRNGCISKGNHPFTGLYRDIVLAANSADPSRIRSAYLDLIKNGNEQTLKSVIFSSDKHGFIRGSMYSKVGGQIARSVIAPNPRLKPTEIGYPRRLALDNSYRVPVTRENIHEIEDLIAQGHITHTLNIQTGEYIRIKDQPNIFLVPGKTLVLRELQDGDVVIMNRQPTLHRNSMLGFIVRLHDDDVFYLHPSATKGFGADFDGDEMNANIPYSSIGQREAQELMFVTFHMASLASSSLLVGYHQDVNLAAHILSMDGTWVPENVWLSMARISWETRWTDMPSQDDAFDAWLEMYKKRCLDQDIDPYSGRGLYSTLLPADLAWTMGDVMVRNGILIDGILNSRNTSGSAASMGMNIYRTYGADETVRWLNGSYRMLNLYLIRLGITMGIQDLILAPERQDRIEEIKDILASRHDLQENVDEIQDSVMKARRESEIIQELNNARETISVLVMDSDEVSASSRIAGHFDAEIKLWPLLSRSNIRVHREPRMPRHDIEDGIWTIHGPGHVAIDLYRGRVELVLDDDPSTRWIWSMALFPRIATTLVTRLNNGSTTSNPVDRTYHMPNPLKMMIESGARGNATNAIQITGIVGQQAYEGGRIPRMLNGGQIPGQNHEDDDKRSMPCYPFGSNSIESRGFIRDSYLQGLGPEEYMGVHVSSRENLTSNVSLTPKTGYFGRRVRTFTENLRVVGPKLSVANEKGMIAMWDYVMDPSRVFALNGKATFADVSFEMKHLSAPSGGRAVVLQVPYRENLKAYVAMDGILRRVMIEAQTLDLVVILDPRIPQLHPDYKEYVQRLVPEELGRLGKTIVIAPSSMGEAWALQLREYDEAIIIPLDTPMAIEALGARIQSLIQYPGSLLGPGIVAAIDLRPSIDSPGYRGQAGNPVPPHIMFQMLTYGTQFQHFPYVIRPSRGPIIPGVSLLDTLTIQGTLAFL